MVMGIPSKCGQLVADFAHAVCAQNKAIEEHDPLTGNEWAKKYCAAAKELLTQGENGLEAFAGLLDDSRVDVRTMAAAFLIPFKTNESKAVLEVSAREFGVVALGAKIALERWKREGRGIDLT